MPAWFFRIIESDHGTWACRRGRIALDEHAAYDEALIHICGLAAEEPPSRVFVHRRDSARATMVAEFDDGT